MVLFAMRRCHCPGTAKNFFLFNIAQAHVETDTFINRTKLQPMYGAPDRIIRASMNMPSEKIWSKTLLLNCMNLAAVVGCAISTLLVYVGLQHNPQGEFYDYTTQSYDYSYILLLFLVNALVIGIAAFIVIVILMLIVKSLIYVFQNR